jgi:hypothetical protein
MLINVYWNRQTGEVIVPTVAQTEAGFWLDTEPVESADWNDPASVSEAVSNATGRSGRVIPTPSRQEFPKPVVLGHSKAKNLNDFERKFDQISIVWLPDGDISVQRYKKVPGDTGRVVDTDMSTRHAASVSFEQLVSELAEEISSKSKWGRRS